MHLVHKNCIFKWLTPSIILSFLPVLKNLLKISCSFIFIHSPVATCHVFWFISLGFTGQKTRIACAPAITNSPCTEYMAGEPPNIQYRKCGHQILVILVILAILAILVILVMDMNVIKYWWILSSPKISNHSTPSKKKCDIRVINKMRPSSRKKIKPDCKMYKNPVVV